MPRPAGQDRKTTTTQPLAPRPPQLTEKQKIETLIRRVERSGLIFIRNGKEYPAEKGASHLRRKWNYAGDRIETARQFVEYIGSGSSRSGKPYQVKFKNGKTMPSGEWMTAILNELEGKASAGGGEARPHPETTDPATRPASSDQPSTATR